MVIRLIKPIESEKLSSFLAKTIMFWACEEFPPTHEMWRVEEYISSLEYLFQELLKAFCEGNLPYFFNPEINILEAIAAETRSKVCEKIVSILEDIPANIPSPFGPELTFSKEISQIAQNLLETLIKFEAFTPMLIRRYVGENFF